MAKITGTQKANISSMNADLGGSMSSAQIRVPAKGNPVLIIGLGGTGMDALLTTKQLINARFELPDSAPNKATAIPDNIRVLGIDSDSTYFSKQKEGGMRFADGEYVSISGSVENYLSNQHLIPEYVKEWLDDPQGIFARVKGNGTDGANGIRQSGRILLFNSVGKVIAAITMAVKKLLTGMAPSQRLQVFILSGISGGTGSGCFIDIPYIIREIIQQEGKKKGDYDMMGVLFTPDVNLSRISNPAIQKYVMRNGFAAMQELEYMMNMSGHLYDPFKQRYTDTFDVNSDNAPFDMCLLVSSTGKDGYVQKDPAERYDFSMAMAAEAVCNFLASSTNQGSFSIDSFKNNISQALQSIVPSWPMNNCFTSVGASAAILPKNEVLEFLSGQLFNRMNDLYTHEPNNEEREAFLAAVYLDQISVEGMFDANLPVLFQGGLMNPSFEKGALKASKLNAEEMGQKWLGHCKDAYDKVMKDEIDIRYNKFIDLVEQSFARFSEGPFYISRLINSNDSYCLLKALKSSLEAERNAIGNYTPQILKNQKDMADQAYANFCNKWLDLTSNSRRDYYNAIRKYYEMQQERMRCEYIVNFYNELIKRITDYNNDLIDNLVGILEELKVVFEKNLNIVTGVEAATNKGRNTTYEWKMYDIKGNQELLDQLNSQVSSVDMENAVDEIMRGMMDKFKKIRSKDDFDIATYISEAVSTKFSKVLTQSMDDFFQAQYPSAASRDDAAKKVLGDLKQKSVIMFPCASGIQSVDILYASIPKESGAIEAAARNDNALSQNYIDSPYNNRISIFTFAAGISPAHHNLMHIYEEGYYGFAENGAKSDKMIGQHLYSNFSGKRDTDWFGLPSPIHDTLRPNEMITDKTAVVKMLNDKHRNDFNRARELNIIDEYGVIYDISKVSVADIEAISFSDNDAASAVKAKAQIEAYVAKLDSHDGADTYGISAMTYMNATQEDGIREAYVKNYGAWRYVEHMLAVYDAAKAAIDKCNAVIEGQQNEKKELQALFEALTTRVLYKEKTFYRYTDNTGTSVNVLNLLKISENIERENFFYFNLLEAFSALEPKQRIYIAKKAEKAHEDDIPDEDIEIMKNILAHCKEKLRAIDDLDLELPEIDLARNEKILDTYKKLMELADSALAMFA